jgi:uncharacterized membrane protein YGL010W
MKCTFDHSTPTGAETFWKFSLWAHIFSWIAQFVGHGLFEGRSPALLDNLLLTLVAPDFVIIEVMFFLGWRGDAYARCKKRIEANIKQFREAKAVKTQ